MACSSGKFEFCESGAEETVQLIYGFQRRIVHLRFENAGLNFYGFEKNLRLNTDWQTVRLNTDC